jgi:hypothetical protein
MGKTHGESNTYGENCFPVISTKNSGLAVVNGAEMESADADGPRRRRRRRKDIELDLRQLPDAISLLIVVVHDTIGLFEALEPSAIPQNGKICAHELCLVMIHSETLQCHVCDTLSEMIDRNWLKYS